MKKIIEKYKNYHPSKWEILSYLLIPIFLGLLRLTNLGEDIWFIINNGRYILNHGFFTIDPFTMHEGLHVVVQQWLPDIIFYKSYDIMGSTGIYVVTQILNIYIIFITYKLLMLVTDKKRSLSVIFTIIISYLYAFMFLYARPQMFSTSILITELYFLEKYFKTNNWKNLISLPILSILLINMHASMWLMLFCFWLPFFLDTFNFKLGRLESKKKDRKYLFIFAIIAALCGFINPYGIKAMSYVLTSYGIPEINNFVAEMKIPDIHTLSGFITYMELAIVIIYYVVFNKNRIQLRYFFLLIGTLFLSISASRGILFFIISSIYPIAVIYKDKFRNNENVDNKGIKMFIIFIILLIIIPSTIIIKNKSYVMDNIIGNGIDYIVKNEDDIKDLKIYCRYECNYAEWVGLKTYIDTRAEVFLKKNNKKADIFVELYDLQSGMIDYKKFLDKYDFDYLVVYIYDFLYDKLLDDENYEIVYENKIDKNDRKNKQTRYLVFKKVEK